MTYVFFGTPAFAATVLKILIEKGLAPETVVCNPDRPVGRTRTLTPPPVKLVAREHSIDVLQPDNVRDIPPFTSLPLFFVVAAYARILPEHIVELPKLGTIGVHPSLLPRHRGPSPIQTAILEGDKETGATLYLMDEKMDHGDILAQATYKMSGKETYKELEDALAELGGNLLVETLPKFIKGEISPQPQVHAEATFTKKFTTEDGFVEMDDLENALGGDEERTVMIDRKIRALSLEPGVWTYGNITGGMWQAPKENSKKKRIKLLEADVENDTLRLKRVQVEGKTPITL